MSNFRQFLKNVARRHGAPVQPICSSFNIVNAIRGREISGPLSKHRIYSTNAYTSVEQPRIAEDAPEVSCLLFDRCGRYIITGCRDQSINIWCSYTGALVHQLRRKLGQIRFASFLGLHPGDNLLAAGCSNGSIDIYDLNTFNRLTTLREQHTLITTSIEFSPRSCRSRNVMVSASMDGTVVFWIFTFDHREDIVVRPNINVPANSPRRRASCYTQPAFSPEGSFLALGTKENVLHIYDLTQYETPVEIALNVNSSVECLKWAHAGLRLVHGSSGEAVIWSYDNNVWKSIHLTMDLTLTDHDTSAIREESVLALCWNASDQYVITATMAIIKVWNSNNGQLIRVLKGNKDVVFVLESHPHNRNVILSVGDIRELYIWDINTEKPIFKFHIKTEKDLTVFDAARWGPDGVMIAAAKDSGTIMIFDFLGYSEDAYTENAYSYDSA